MLTLKIDLIANRYHANPWNRAHVEGVVEWPPSPWRLLRAILSGGFTAGIEEAELLPLVVTLAEHLPSFYLPQGSYLQTRTPRKDRIDTVDLFGMGKDVVDAYLNFDVSDRMIWVQWPVELCAEHELLLTRCLAYCRYIGRREADAVWSIARDDEMPSPNARPDTAGTTAVACCDGDAAALLVSPYQSQVKEKRAVFKGLCWRNYHVEIEPPAGLMAPTPTYHRATIAIRTKGRPQAHSAPLWADKLHQALARMGTPNFTGCDLNGFPLRTHDHVFIQPTLDDSDLVGFELHCEAGFTDAEIEHLYAVRKLYAGKNGEMELRVLGLHCDRGEAVHKWKSATPFFLSRHPQTRNGRPRLIPGTQHQKDSPEHQALKALCYLPQFDLAPSQCTFESVSMGLAMVHSGQLIAMAHAERWAGSFQWQCDRKHGKKAGGTGYRLSLSFPEPIEGPIALGYSAHFGLGMMRGAAAVPAGVSAKAAETVMG